MVNCRIGGYNIKIENGFYIPDEGFIFKRISDDMLIDDKLFLGKDDSIDKYEEIDINQTWSKLETMQKQLEAQTYFNAKSLGIQTNLPIEEEAHMQMTSLGNLDISKIEEGSKWIVGVKVDIGQIVVYDNKQYQCIQTHITQEDWIPSIVPVLWKEIVNEEIIQDFKQPTGSHDAYNINDKVLFEGNIYESIVNGNVYSPSVYPANWKLININK